MDCRVFQRSHYGSHKYSRYYTFHTTPQTVFEWCFVEDNLLSIWKTKFSGKKSLAVTHPQFLYLSTHILHTLCILYGIQYTFLMIKFLCFPISLKPPDCLGEAILNMTY